MKTQGFVRSVRPRQFKLPLWLASLSLNILALMMPVSILLIFDRIIPFQSTHTLRAIAVALLVAGLLELILRQCRSVLLAASAADEAIANHRGFLGRILSANTRAFAQEPTSAFAERYAAIGQLRDHQAGQGQTLTIDMPFTILFAVMIGFIGGWLVVVPISAFCGVFAFACLVKNTQWQLFDKRKSLDARRYAFLSELLSQMPVVKANRMEPQMTRRFEMLEDQTVEVSRKLILFSGLSQSFGAVFSQVTVAAMGLLGAYLVIQNSIGLAELAACMLLNGRIVQPLTKLISLWVQSESVAVAKRKLDEVHALQVHDQDACPGDKLRGTVVASGVTLGRPGGVGASFAPVTFSAGPSEYILIDAEEAWMIEAFFDAVMGQRVPDGGSVLVDDIPAARRVAHRGEGGIAILEAEPALLSGTLIENLSAFGDADMIERSKAIAATLGLESRIHRLPSGYNTLMNSGSAFEKDPVNRQLIALTRVLALRPRVLLMNEPTAVLDTPERDALAACLKALSSRPTLLVASPDPRLRNCADQRIWISGDIGATIEDWVQDSQYDSLMAVAHQKGVA